MGLFQIHSYPRGPVRNGMICAAPLLLLMLASDSFADTATTASTKSLQVAAARLPENADELRVDSSIEPTKNVAPLENVQPYEILDLSRGETFNLFAMGKKVWGDTGLPVRVYVLPSRHPLHKKFAKQKIGSFPHVLDAIWDRYVYSGSGQRPHEVKDEQEMRDAVSSVKGAVGYLSDPADPSRIILVRNK